MYCEDPSPESSRWDPIGSKRLGRSDRSQITGDGVGAFVGRLWWQFLAAQTLLRLDSAPMNHADTESAWRPTGLTFSPPNCPRVLVAEDDSEMRRVVVETLQKDGYAVSEVTDGGRLLVTMAREYMHKDGAELVDLLVTDVRMPICTGLQILEQLRAVHCPLPIVLMTAFGDETTRRHARTLGAVLLDKPFQMEHLRAVVARHLGLRP